MTDLIPLDAAIDRLTALSCDDNAHWGAIIDALRAIPAIYPAAIREDALREAAAVIIDIRDRHGVMPSRYEIMPQRWREAILALIGEKK